jgi:hypothetical protein
MRNSQDLLVRPVARWPGRSSAIDSARSAWLEDRTDVSLGVYLVKALDLVEQMTVPVLLEGPYRPARTNRRKSSWGPWAGWSRARRTCRRDRSPGRNGNRRNPKVPAVSASDSRSLPGSTSRPTRTRARSVASDLGSRSKSAWRRKATEGDRPEANRALRTLAAGSRQGVRAVARELIRRHVVPDLTPSGAETPVITRRPRSTRAQVRQGGRADGSR